MNLLFVTFLGLVHTIFAVALTTVGNPSIAKPTHQPLVTSKPYPDSTKHPQLIPLPLIKPTSKDPLQELFATNPSIQTDPSILSDPSQPYPDINHNIAPAPATKKGLQQYQATPFSNNIPSAAAPTPAGTYLGRSGSENFEFQRKCQKCCRVTKRIFAPWKNAPTHGCNYCGMNTNLDAKKYGKCKEGRHLGFFNAPDDCFFERCHQMLLSRTGNCMCYWDTMSSRSSGIVAR